MSTYPTRNRQSDLLLKCSATVAACALTACLDAPPILARDAGGDARPAPLPVLEVFDARGGARSPEAAPRRPVIFLRGAARYYADTEPVMLFAGAGDETLANDLRSRPLTQASEARRVLARIERRGADVIAIPVTTLEAGGEYQLSLAGWAIDGAVSPARPRNEPLLYPVHVSMSADDGARAVDAWPPDGAASVAPSLDGVAVRFDGIVGAEADALVMTTPRGPVPLVITRRECEELGWPRGGSCLAATWSAPLEGGVTYTVRIGDLRDGAGAQVERWQMRFTTTRDEPSPLSCVAPACARDEIPLECTCALAFERSLHLRMNFDAPVRVFASAGGAVDRTISADGTVELTFEDLVAGDTPMVEVRAHGANDGARILRFATPLATAMPAITLTEVSPSPAGTDARGEYVELINFGAMPVDLRDFSLSDDVGGAGDRIVESFVVHPNERVLLVSTAFERGTYGERAPAPGVRLLALDNALGRSGLANDGERLVLRDSAGRRVAEVPPLPVEEGRCIVRRASSGPRARTSSAFVLTRVGGCTPGGEDEAPPP